MKIIRLKNDAFGRNILSKVVCIFFNNVKSKCIDTDFLSKTENYILVAIDNENKVLGFMYGYELQRIDTNKSMFFLYSIDVLEKERKKGIAKQLIVEFKRICHAKDCLKMFVITNESNIAAMNLYKSTEGIKKYQDGVLFEYI